jgi:exocyst complex component 4
MLRTTPFHRENYARLILTVIIQFYQRCSDRFQVLIESHPSVDHDTGVAIAAQCAQNQEVIACLGDLYHASIWTGTDYTVESAMPSLSSWATGQSEKGN